MKRRSKTVGSGELLRFYMDHDRFPGVDGHGVAVIAALLVHVRTSGRGLYHARASQETLMRVSRSTRPTVAKWLKHYEDGGFLRVTRRRAGRRNGVNDYDVTPAVEAILEQRAGRRFACAFDVSASRELVNASDRVRPLRVIQGGIDSA